MSPKVRATFNDFLLQALDCARSVEKSYLERSIRPDAFPRSVADFLTVVKTNYSTIHFDVRTIPFPTRNFPMSEIVLFRSGADKSATIALSKMASDFSRFALCRGVFLVLLRFKIPDVLIDDGQAVLRAHVDETIFRSWEKGLSEGAREIIPSNLLEVLADIAAAEFLFPYRERLKTKARDPESVSLLDAAKKYGIPLDIAKYYTLENTMGVFSGFPILLPPA